MKKEVVIVGDVEIGGGTLTDDFISDRALSKLILSFAKHKNPVDFIFNGDTFDFMKCPYLVDGKETYPRHISAKMSLSKLQMMVKAHPKMFDAMSTFVKNKKNRIYFIIGNHDHDLFFKEVQNVIKSLLGRRSNVFFRMMYRQNSIQAEHGHQYDFLNKINPRNAFHEFQGKKILNLPWVAYGLIGKFMDIKEEHPFTERIRPRQEYFAHHRAPFKKVTMRSIEYFFKSVIWYPLRYFYDPTYLFPKGLFYQFYIRMKNVHWDVDSIVGKFKKKNKKSLKNKKLVVLGHIHETYLEEKEGWALIHPDTWRDEYDLDVNSKTLIPKEKKYVHAIIEDGKLDWNLKVYPIKRSQNYSIDICKDEKKCLKQAAKEEGFTT